MAFDSSRSATYCREGKALTASLAVFSDNFDPPLFNRTGCKFDKNFSLSAADSYQQSDSDKLKFVGQSPLIAVTRPGQMVISGHAPAPSLLSPLNPQPT